MTHPAAMSSLSAEDMAVLRAARRDLVDLIRACIDPKTGRERAPSRAALMRALHTLPDLKVTHDETAPLPVPDAVRFRPVVGAGT